MTNITALKQEADKMALELSPVCRFVFYQFFEAYLEELQKKKC